MPWGVAAAAVIGAVGTNVAANKANKAQKDAAKVATQQLQDSTGQARSDIGQLFPQAQQAGQQGFQGAIDMFNQGVNPQMQAFQGGNVAAQNQILAGLPQIQNALLGNQVDYSQLQAYQAPQQDLSFMDQQLNYQPLAMPTPNATINPQQISPLQGSAQGVDMMSPKGWLAGNKKVLESDPANRLAKKVASKDPVIRGLKKLFSDERLKEDIRQVGELAGHKLYAWTWKDTEVTRSFAGDAGIGFIAQDVEKTNPNAVTIDSSGYKKITIAELFDGTSL